MNRVGIYIRVSTDKQAEKGSSVPEQIERLEAYCKARDLPIFEKYIDGGYSGGNMDRPALKSLVDDCRAHRIDGVIVYKLDRLSRSQKDTLYLIEEIFEPNGIAFVSLCESFDTGTPLGKAMIGILSVFAQLERSQIKERMIMGAQARAKTGKWKGGALEPTGYRYDPSTDRLEVIPEEAAFVRRVFELFLNGMSYRGILTTCKAEGYSVRRSNLNQHDLIRRILTNDMYIGKYHYGEIHVDGFQEPLVTEEQFYAAQERVKRVTELASDKGSHFLGTHLLSGLVYCKKCGKKVHTLSSKSGNNSRRYYYKCQDKCTIGTVKIERLEGQIKEAILSFKYEDITEKSKKPRDYSAELKKLKSQQDKLIELYALGNLDIGTIQEKIDGIKQKIDIINAEANSVRARSLINESFNNGLTVARDLLENGSMEQKRALVQSLVAKVEILSDDDIDVYWNLTS